MLSLIQCIWFYLELISCFLLPFESEFPFMILVIIFIGGRMDIKIGLNKFFFLPYYTFSHTLCSLFLLHCYIRAVSVLCVAGLLAFVIFNIFHAVAKIFNVFCAVGKKI